MGKLFFIIIHLTMVISSCQTIEPTNDVEIEVVVEDMVNNYDLPTEGYYYEYQFENYLDKISNVEEVLKEYILSGVSMQDAWYKGGASSCHPPNAQYAMQVIVEPEFVVRTKFASDLLLNSNFIQVEKPHRFFCGYRVRHFIFGEG